MDDDSDHESGVKRLAEAEEFQVRDVRYNLENLLANELGIVLLWNHVATYPFQINVVYQPETSISLSLDWEVLAFLFGLSAAANYL